VASHVVGGKPPDITFGLKGAVSFSPHIVYEFRGSVVAPTIRVYVGVR